MKNVLRLFGMIAAVAVIGLSMTGCATNTSRVIPGWDQQLLLPCGEDVRNYTILGIVQVEESRRVILGGVLSTPIGDIGPYFLRRTSGTATYAGLLREARRRFPNANAVIGVQIDRVDSNVAFFFSTRTYTLTGLAVEFAAEPNTPMGLHE